MANLIRFPYRIEVPIYHAELTPYGNNFVQPSSIQIISLNTDEVYAEIQAKQPTSLSGLFKNMSGLTELDLSNWNVTSYEQLISMFYGCSGLTSLNVSGWSFNNANLGYNISEMFVDCTNLATLNMSNWDTSRVIDCGYMFYQCKALTELDLSGWNTSNATLMGEMFYGCKNLRKIWVPSTFVATAVTDSNEKPFNHSTGRSGGTHVYTDAASAAAQGWGTINSNFTMHYGATHSDYENA